MQNKDTQKQFEIFLKFKQWLIDNAALTDQDGNPTFIRAGRYVHCHSHYTCDSLQCDIVFDIKTGTDGLGFYCRQADDRFGWDYDWTQHIVNNILEDKEA